MKKINNFAVQGFVAKSEIREFNTANKAQFVLGISRREKKGEEFVTTKGYIQCEAWRKAESKEFELLRKGAEVLVEGFFEPQTWEDAEGKRVRIVFAATKISKVEAEEEEQKQEEVAAEEPKKDKPRRKKKAEKEA